MGEDDIGRLYDKMERLSDKLIEVGTNQKWVMDAVKTNGEMLSRISQHGCQRGEADRADVENLKKRLNGSLAVTGKSVGAEPWFKFGFGKYTAESHGSLALLAIIACLAIAWFGYSMYAGMKRDRAVDLLLQLQGVDVTHVDAVSKALTDEAKKEQKP